MEDDCGDDDSTLRQYSCVNYAVCLDLAAALNWDGFSCVNCPGTVNQALCWRAHQAQKKDRVVSRICSIPEIVSVVADDPEQEVA